MEQKTEPKTTQPKFCKSELSQFSGDLERWQSGINRSVIYTPGVKYLAEKGEAQWLIDAIASYLVPDVLEPAGKKDPRILGLHFWKLEVAEDKSAVLYAEADLNVKPFVTQAIPYTDFLFPEIAIWAGFDGRYWVLYLPSEH